MLATYLFTLYFD